LTLLEEHSTLLALVLRWFGCFAHGLIFLEHFLRSLLHLCIVL
jgi:hypothetical protein